MARAKAQIRDVIAPGAHVLVRDAIWRVLQVRPTSHGTRALHVVGASEIVRDQYAIFLEDYEPSIELLDPRETKLVPDASSGHRAGLLYIESLLRDVPPTGAQISVGHRAALDLLDFQLDPTRLALGQLRARILIADAVGLGKTLEAGILLSELARRGRARRILVVTTRAMLTQFQKELWTRFALPLVRLDSRGLQHVRERIPTNHNPFHYYDRAIISIDTLKQNNVFRRHVETARWDVIVIDEAHNVAERGRVLAERARLAATLAGRSDALVLLTATPHDGKPRSFASLVNMLDPTAIANPEKYTKDEIHGLYVRRFKKDVEAQVAREFPRPEIARRNVPASPAEEAAYDALTAIRFERLDQRQAGRLLFRSVLEKSLFSSPLACLETIAARIKTLEAHAEAASFGGDVKQLRVLEERVRAVGAGDFSKYQALVALLRDKKSGWHWKPASADRLVIFTERRETLRFLEENLPGDLGLKAGEVRVLHGSVPDTEQQEIVEEFGKDSAKVRLLLATDIASEGLNLHFLCHRLVHFDVPWSLLVFQQRNGRIDRYGQSQTPRILYLLTASQNAKIRGDVRVLECLTERDEKAGENIGDPSAFQGEYDIDAQEQWTEKAMQDQLTPAQLEERAQPREDLLELLLGSGLDDAPAPARPVEPPSLFESDADYLEKSLSYLREESGLKFEVNAEARTLELTLPEDLRRRFGRLPREIVPEDGVLCLTPDKAVLQGELRAARAEEEVWPRLQYLWGLHPVFAWANDKARARFTRLTAPVLTVTHGLDAGERVFVVSGLVPNRRAQPVVHRWYGVSFVGKKLRAVEPIEALLERTHLGREPLPNAGEPDDLDELGTLVAPALEEARRRVLNERERVDHDLRARLERELARLRELRERREQRLADDYKDRRGERAKAEHERELRRVDEVWKELEGFTAGALTTEPVPFLQVVAVLRRDAESKGARR